METLIDLLLKAEAANQGPWKVSHGDEASGVDTPEGPLTWDDHGGEVFTRENAEYIASFDPSTAIRILKRLELAEASRNTSNADRDRWRLRALRAEKIAESDITKTGQYLRRHGW